MPQTLKFHFYFRAHAKRRLGSLKLKNWVLSSKEGHRHSIHPADSGLSINDWLKYVVAGYCFVQHLFGDGYSKHRIPVFRVPVPSAYCPKHEYHSVYRCQISVCSYYRQLALSCMLHLCLPYAQKPSFFFTL